MVHVLRAAEELLSQQPNYDFGMRALKSVLLAAGAALRGSSADDNGADTVHDLTPSQELKVFVQTLHEMLLPKLTSADSVVVEGLIQVHAAVLIIQLLMLYFPPVW